MKYFLLLFYIGSSLGYAESYFFKNREAGWFWYKDPEIQHKKEKVTKADHSNQVDLEKEKLEQALKIAIKEPTEENIVSFIKLRNQVIDQSYNFGLRLQQVNLMHPELDKLETFPSNDLAKDLYSVKRREEITQKIGDLSKTHGLFYVFSSNCPYCINFAPTVKSFANKFGWQILPITLDGKSISEFPNARLDNGMARQLNIKNVPALIMVEPRANKVMPIATGIISEEEIVERIDLLTKGYN